MSLSKITPILGIWIAIVAISMGDITIGIIIVILSLIAALLPDQGEN